MTSCPLTLYSPKLLFCYRVLQLSLFMKLVQHIHTRAHWGLVWKSVSALDPDQQILDTFRKRQVNSRVVAGIVDINNYFHSCRCAFCGSRCRVNTSQVLINCILGQWHGKNQYLPWPTTNTSRSVQFMPVSQCLCGGKKAFARTANKCVHVLCVRVKLDHKSRRGMP